jgi:hypothetical protein
MRSGFMEGKYIPWVANPIGQRSRFLPLRCAPVEMTASERG